LSYSAGPAEEDFLPIITLHSHYLLGLQGAGSGIVLCHQRSQSHPYFPNKLLNFCFSVTHTITQWIQEYGSVVSVCQGSQVSVIIGSVEVCGQLLNIVLREDGWLSRQPTTLWRKKEVLSLIALMP
jgi:hypothetical protein